MIIVSLLRVAQGWAEKGFLVAYMENAMLVLSRKEGESLVIGDNITITINRISGNRITVGVDAPPDVRIIRGELEFAPSGPTESDPDPIIDRITAVG